MHRTDLTFIRPHLVGLCCLFFAVQIPLPSSAADCSQIYEQAQKAPASNPEFLSQLLKEAQPRGSDSGCDQSFIDALKRRAGNAYLERAEALARSGKGTEAAALLDRAIDDGVRVWQIHAVRGDLAMGAKDRVTAVKNFESALELIERPDETPKAPDAKIIRDLHNKAQSARLLLPEGTYVEPKRDRAGNPAGILAPSIRGHVVEQVALAIQFEFGTDHFTKLGEQEAADLLEALTKQQPAVIRLVGHTDPVGSDEFNDDLSVRRAEAVKRFLVQGGYSGKIETAGRGKREPNKLADPALYSKDEQHQMHRRVELDRK